MNDATLENSVQLIKIAVEAVRKYEYMNFGKSKSRQNTSALCKEIFQSKLLLAQVLMTYIQH